MARCTTPTCVLTLPLHLEKWQEDRLAKRFEIARKIYNALLGAELKKLRRLEQTPKYRAIKKDLAALYGDKEKNADRIRALYKKRNKLSKDNSFTEYGFTVDAKLYYKHFRTNIGSCVAVHCIAPQVWSAFEKYLFGNGKRIHFKRPGEIYSLRGYSSKTSSGVEIIYRGDHIEWNKLRLPLKLDPGNQYEEEMLTNRVKYVRILRRPGKNRDHWYAQLTLEGLPSIKRDDETGDPVHSIGNGPVGIDIGPQTIAYSSSKEAGLLELADRVQNIENKKCRIQRKMDRSRRAANPGNYNPDGTIKRGVPLTRNKSKRYLRLQNELAWIQHQQAAIRKEQHVALANYLLTLGDYFYIEDMNWQGLARRAKETAIPEPEKEKKCRRKKRFGKSIANKAPATLVTILKNKCTSLGLPGVIPISTKVRASQYNHLTDSYQKKELSQRWNEMPDGRKIQRDLYSAFLLQHMNSQLDGFDRAALQRDYESFVSLHDQAILRAAAAPKLISSMGVKRTAN